MIHLALYHPDIPQNTGAAIRLCACLDVPLDIIEPCGFVWDNRKIRKAALDYADKSTVIRHLSWDKFFARYTKRRVIALSAHADTCYTDFMFQNDDILLMGRESAGLSDTIHQSADARITIPMATGARSLNVINAASMVLGEALRQTEGFFDE